MSWELQRHRLANETLTEVVEDCGNDGMARLIGAYDKNGQVWTRNGWLSWRRTPHRYPGPISALRAILRGEV